MKSVKEVCVPMSLERIAKPHKGRWKTYWENRLHGDTFYSFFTNRMLVDGKKRKSDGREVRKMKDFKNEQHLIVAIIWA